MCVDLLRLLADRDQSVLSRLAYRIRRRVGLLRKRRTSQGGVASRTRRSEVNTIYYFDGNRMEGLPNGPTMGPDAETDIPLDNNNPLLSIESLLEMSPLINDIDLVGRACRHLFMSHIKNQKSVHDLFFPDQTRDLNEDRLDPNWFDFDEFAALFVCQAIKNIKDPYKIHSLVDGSQVEEILADCYSGPLWKKIGFAMYTMLFADLVCDKETRVPFRAYMEGDRVFWAKKLYEQIRDPQWQYRMVHPVIRGQHCDRTYNRDMNLILVKLHLLDPTQVFPAFNQLRKALPDLNMELVTTNYLGEPFDWHSIKPEVESAIYRPMLPSNAPRMSFSDYEMYYGIQVTEFIMQLPRQMGLWTGEYPDNKRTSKLRDRCILM